MLTISNKIHSYIKERKSIGKSIAWTNIWAWNAMAAGQLKFRKEKWIRKIMRLTNGIEVDGTREGVVYIMVNPITKKLYIGQTKFSMRKRWSQHYHASRKDKKRSTYRYFNRIGFENWVMYPLEYSC
jgi:hypothetical protein